MLQEIISIWLSFTPWLLLGTLIASAMKIWIPKNWINKHLGSSSGVWKAVALGVPLPLCSCGVIPTGLGLKKQGATTGATVGFLISTPQTGVDSILVTSAFLGWPFAIAKVLIALITGLIGGYLTQYFVKETDLVHTDHTDHESCEIDDHANGHSETHKENVSIWEQLVDDSLELIAPIWKWIVFGVFLSATISYYLPASQFEKWFGQDELSTWLGMIISLAISLPLYVCATASIPIASALVAKGFGIGAALIFLLAGPASNVATIGAVYQALGKKVVTIYLGTLIISSLFFGWFLEKIIVLKAHALHPGHLAHEHHHFQIWEYISAILVFLVFAYLFYQEVSRTFKIQKINQTQGVEMSASNQTQIIKVNGMTCMGCANRLEKVLSKVEGVTAVQVTLKPDQATIQGNAKTTDLEKSIENAGFEVVK